MGFTIFTKMQKDLIANLRHQAVKEMLKVWFLQEKYPNFDPAENHKEHMLQHFGDRWEARNISKSVLLYLFTGTKFILFIYIYTHTYVLYMYLYL